MTEILLTLQDVDFHLSENGKFVTRITEHPKLENSNPKNPEHIGDDIDTAEDTTEEHPKLENSNPNTQEDNPDDINTKEDTSDEHPKLENSNPNQGRIQGVASIAWDTVRFSAGRNNYFVY